VVVDGTWSQTRKVLRNNPALAALPRFAFTPPRPSQYEIRREPRAECVSTIEALAYVLGALEGDPERFLAMLAPFRAMVRAQVACRDTLRRGRVRHPRAPCSPRNDVQHPLRAVTGDLVCVAGEASAWPRDEAATRPVEVVQWVAYRVRTGERFEGFARPTETLAPATAWQTGIDAWVLCTAPTRDALLAAWRAFVRDDDVLCTWGEYPTTIMHNAGGYLPPTRINVRTVARTIAKGAAGTNEAFLTLLGAPWPAGERMGCGRAGERLAQLVATVQRLR
jgi:hypothetical protein